MLNRDFWKGAFERALKTFIQAFIATVGFTAGTQYGGADIVAAPWLTALCTAGIAAVLSVVTSVGNADFVAGNGPRQIVASATTVPDDTLAGSDGVAVVGGYEPRRAAVGDVS